MNKRDSNKLRPPVFAAWLLKKLTYYEMNFSSSDNLEENYRRLTASHGKIRALVWYWFQVVMLIPSCLKMKIIWSFIMFRNYIKIAVRNLIKNKIYVLINIAGGNDLSLHEVNEVNDVIIRQVDPEANIIFGTTIDAALDDRVRVTVIATGFDRKRNMLAKGHSKDIGDETGTSLQLIEGRADSKVSRKVSGNNQTFRLDYDKKKMQDLSQEDLEIPAFLRRTLD